MVLLTGLLFLGGLISCVEIDNYEAPAETIQGTIYSAVTGEPLQVTENEIRIELLELSWTETTPTPNPYFYANDGGTYKNSRIFKGFYNVNVNGPFVPLNHKLWPAPNTDTINLSANITIKGVVTQDFTVEPILDIQWVTEPVYNASDKSISATIIVNRGTTNPLYNAGAIKNINFYACEVAYPGDNNYDNRYSKIKNSFPGNETIVIDGVTKPNAFVFGQPYIVKTIGQLTPRKWWLRVGANTNRSLPTGTPYNYSTIKSVTVN